MEPLGFIFVCWLFVFAIAPKWTAKYWVDAYCLFRDTYRERKNND